MKTPSKIIRSCAVAVLLPLPFFAQATTVINFDDLNPDYGYNANFGPNYTVPPAGYQGLTWVNTIVERASAFIPGSLNLNVSTPNVATDINYLSYSTAVAPIQFSSAAPFTFNSAYFIAAATDGLQVLVKGLANGIVVDQSSFTVGTQTPVLGVFNWSGIDTVIMTASGGSNPNTHQSFVFDNVVVNGPTSVGPAVPAVPEPETWAMLLAGLAGAAVMQRQRTAGVKPGT